MEFENKVVLITGAAGAIGKGIARRFCENGACAFLTDLDQAKLDAACAEISDTPGTAKALAADVTKHDQVKAVVEAAKAITGNIDVLVNCAGVVAQGPVEDIEEDEWDFIFDVNCKGTFLFIKEVVPVMKAAGSGKIVNFSSKSGKTGSAIMSHYSAAKAAIIGLTQALAFELAPNNINVNCVCPGITMSTGVWGNVSAGYVEHHKMSEDEIVKKFTAKIPLGRLAYIEDVASVTYFLSTKGSDYMTGQSLNITGGREMH